MKTRLCQIDLTNEHAECSERVDAVKTLEFILAARLPTADWSVCVVICLNMFYCKNAQKKGASGRLIGILESNGCSCSAIMVVRYVH